jgi:hypothetical protein
VENFLGDCKNVLDLLVIDKIKLFLRNEIRENLFQCFDYHIGYDFVQGIAEGDGTKIFKWQELSFFGTIAIKV